MCPTKHNKNVCSIRFEVFMKKDFLTPLTSASTHCSGQADPNAAGIIAQMWKSEGMWNCTILKVWSFYLIRASYFQLFSSRHKKNFPSSYFRWGNFSQNFQSFLLLYSNSFCQDEIGWKKNQVLTIFHNWVQEKMKHPHGEQLRNDAECFPTGALSFVQLCQRCTPHQELCTRYTLQWFGSPPQKFISYFTSIWFFDNGRHTLQ